MARATNPVELTCKGCPNKFIRVSNQLFCTVQCKNRFQDRKRYPRRPPIRIPKDCLHCGTHFIGTNRKKYCSSICENRGGLIARSLRKRVIIDKVCAAYDCYNYFKTHNNRHMYCSDKCRETKKLTAHRCVICKRWYIVNGDYFSIIRLKICGSECFIKMDPTRKESKYFQSEILPM